LRVLFIL